jgi:hypothetical protein
MLKTIRDSLSSHGASDDKQDGVREGDRDEDTELGKLSDDEPGYVIGTTAETVQLGMDSFRPKGMRPGEWTHPELGDTANYFREINTKHRTAELKLPDVVNHQLEMIAATPSPITFGEHMQTLPIVRGQLYMQSVPFR